jgi:N-acetyl-1-D-myo-inositol-2-amino-2-deoxy-alpha-D-glucopyranoside deacetylase
MKVNLAVVRALEALREVPGGWLPLRLYYDVIPRSRLRWFILLLRLTGKDPRRFGRNSDVDLTQVGVPDREIHVRVNVERHLAEKEAAGACHRSQGGGGRLSKGVGGLLWRRAMRYEHFVWAGPGEPESGDDLFSGLPEGFQYL